MNAAEAVKKEAEDQLKKKSAGDRLEDIETQLEDLEEKRKELLFEIAKEEAAESEEVHKNCISEETLKEEEERADDAETHAEETEWAYQALENFGGHKADCLQGAVTGHRLHPLCTCGWNEIATEIERRPPSLVG